MSLSQSHSAGTPANDRTPMLRQPVSDPRAWTRATLRKQDYQIALPESCQEELLHALAMLRRHPVALTQLDADAYALPQCRALMAQVKAVLDDGVMFAVLDRLDLQRMCANDARAAYWLLCSLMSQPVAQRYNGEMIFEVLDKKVPIVPGSGVRPTVSNVDMSFHSDSSYHMPQPDYIALLCLGTPASGGVSRVASLYTVHNAMLAQHPDKLQRLYQPFWYDRYREHAEGQCGIAQYPMLSFDGERLNSRVALPEIAAGFTLKGEPIDAAGQAAIEALKGVFAQDGVSTEFSMQRGQIQFVNNRQALHSRTDFVDSPDGQHRRHLVRLWLRDEGQRGFMG
ncbi:MAG TPA: TauD/TfdA family dioxygenase [Bordetella sp.]|nr:TauD/TfdA family dioxygenase [Bordetella sp.]